jgi:hypothetical protein
MIQHLTQGSNYQSRNPVVTLLHYLYSVIEHISHDLTLSSCRKKQGFVCGILVPFTYPRLWFVCICHIGLYNLKTPEGCRRELLSTISKTLSHQDNFHPSTVYVSYNLVSYPHLLRSLRLYKLNSHSSNRKTFK